MIEINGLINWFIHWFVDWINIQMGSHNLSVCGSTVCVQSVGCTMPIRLGEGGGLSGERPCFEAAGFQSEGRWREKGGRGGGVGRLGASVGREESWEMLWCSNYGHRCLNNTAKTSSLISLRGHTIWPCDLTATEGYSQTVSSTGQPTHCKGWASVNAFDVESFRGLTYRPLPLGEWLRCTRV